MTEKKREYQKIYRETPKNKEKARLAAIEYRNDPKRIAYRKEYRIRVKPKITQERQEEKKKVMDAMGGKCVQCGFNNYKALQIDHINGDGHLDKNGGRGYGFKYYTRVLTSFLNKEGRYQLLCANCNWIKRFDNKEYLSRNK